MDPKHWPPPRIRRPQPPVTCPGHCCPAIGFGSRYPWSCPFLLVTRIRDGRFHRIPSTLPGRDIWVFFLSLCLSNPPRLCLFHLCLFHLCQSLCLCCASQSLCLFRSNLLCPSCPYLSFCSFCSVVDAAVGGLNGLDNAVPDLEVDVVVAGSPAVASGVGLLLAQFANEGKLLADGVSEDLVPPVRRHPSSVLDLALEV